MASLEGWNFTIKLCPRWTRKLPRAEITAKRFLPAPTRVCYLSDRWLANGMRILLALLLFAFTVLNSARADLTITQKVEGTGQDREATVKIKGDKERIDSAGNPSQIIDGKSGDMINLQNDSKTYVKISAEQIKAAAEAINKFGGDQKSKPKLTPSGKKEKINGYDTAEYLYETPQFKVSFWVATNYPGATEILKEMQVPMSGAWKQSSMGMPEYTDFPGLPIRTVISMQGNSMTTTITSIKKDPVNAGEFEIPKGFQEMKAPVGGAPEPAANPAGSPSGTP
jgi:Domain of unknown function (DUF4412)